MIELHPEEKMPLYEQLYNALAQDIRSGALQPGKACRGGAPWRPSLASAPTRWILPTRCLRRKGWLSPGPAAAFCSGNRRHAAHPPAAQRGSRPKNHVKNTVSNQDDILYDLSTGSIDTSLFPARSWGRIQKELMYQRPELLQRGDMQGMKTCAPRLPPTLANTAAWTAQRIRSWSGPGWSTCWAAWHTCLRAAPPRWKTPATAAPAPYWKTTASPAYRWKLTKAVCRSAR